ncbi:MAG: flagellar motor protein MotB [Pseudomonadota bacterium]
MLRRQSKKGRPEDEEDWLVTYADAITLVLAFFVIIVAISKVDLPKLEAVQAGIQAEWGKRNVQRPIGQLEAAVQDVLSDMQVSNRTSVRKDFIGLVIEIDATELFQQGSDVLLGGGGPPGSPVGVDLANDLMLTVLRPAYNSYVIEIQGHTSPTSFIGNNPSAWELSGGRATNLVRLFISQGISADRLTAKAYADTLPRQTQILEETSSVGEDATEEDLAKEISDERIVIRIHPRVDARGNKIEPPATDAAAPQS